VFESQSRQRYLSAFIVLCPPLWSGGQSSWLQIQRSRVRFPALPHFVRSRGGGLKSSGSGTGPLSLVRIAEELVVRKSSGSDLEKNEINGRWDQLRRPRDTALHAKVGSDFADKWRSIG
jgi:hypothetical protein